MRWWAWPMSGGAGKGRAGAKPPRQPAGDARAGRPRPRQLVGGDDIAQPSGRARFGFRRPQLAGARLRRSKSVAPLSDGREPEREIELHLTGNMERYMWSFDGKKYSEAKTPIPFRYGERLRLIFVNDTMMEHPIHLHGMWMELENGAGPRQPRKHTISVKPAERLSVAITADAPGPWAMHCHLLLHMEMGMFRVVEVSPKGPS